MIILLNIGLIGSIISQLAIPAAFGADLNLNKSFAPINPAVNTIPNEGLSLRFDSRPLIIEECLVGINNPKTAAKTPKRLKVFITAYTSRTEETDDTPHITASGTKTRPGIVASNFLPFGTIIKIPSIFGPRKFVIEDRMHHRYQKTIDVWFESVEEAFQFGRKVAEIEII